jgi:uncharacterized protein YmfQ (DUF2313 family)
MGKIMPGWALGARGGVLDTVMSAGADQIAYVEQLAEDLMSETDPRSAVNLLPDFERVLGPDPCGRDLDPLSIPERQMLAHQRWTARGGQSISYMISIAANLGVTITIEEFWPSKAGRLKAGQPLRGEGCQFVYRVNVPGLVQVIPFRAGYSRAGNPLGDFKLSNIECELRRVAPAHTEVVFSYSEAA